VGVPNLSQRASGLLLHMTSLPGPHGNGDLGSAARRFIDFLQAAGQSFWQMLPVGPTGYGNSPYSAQSAFAGSPLLIALEPLQRAGYLSARDLARAPRFDSQRVDYIAAERFRGQCLRATFAAARHDARLEQFREQNRDWLEDFALFRALKSAHGEVEWTRWPSALRDRDPNALRRVAAELADEVALRCFEQWLFSEQWRELRDYSHQHGVALIGDIPIFVAHDSADVWQHRELFHLDDMGLPSVVSGVPPDYFSSTGQRWGNPIYHWARVRDTNYRFWIERMRSMLERFDVVRLDHFIGFCRGWEIPSHEETAVNGRWVDGPGAGLFEALQRELGDARGLHGLPLIAEDLGVVTDEVKALRDRFELPGIKILQFAFGSDPSAPDFLPHNYLRRSVVYTGTHDNDTTHGWFTGESEGSTRSAEQVETERNAVLAYLGASDGTEIHWDMIRMCLLSVANTAIFPVQDVLGLGSEARMNQPGRATGNWEWRVDANALDARLAERLAKLTRLFGRQLSAANTPART
jgi:4-alpha-glucanotransferase